VAKTLSRTARPARGAWTGSVVCGGACPALMPGTGARKKGASPQLYGEGPRDEPSGRRLVVAVIGDRSRSAHG